MGCAGILAGCGKPASTSPKSLAEAPVPDASNAPASQVVPDPEREPKDGEKKCFACDGIGPIKCTAPGCVAGQVDCPAACLKRDRGVCIHMDVAGHPPTDIWQKFYQSDGSYMAYKQNHIGHVIVMKNGLAVDTGPCTVCGGSGKVPCKVCQGTGQVPCPICEGKKYIPVSWTPTDNPWLNRQPDLIRLRSGEVLLGQVMHSNEVELLVKTRAGKWTHIAITNILPKLEVPNTNAP